VHLISLQRRFGREDVDSASGPASPLPAVPAWFWPGVGVGSGAWVPAWPPNRPTPLGLSWDRLVGRAQLLAPTGAAGL